MWLIILDYVLILLFFTQLHAISWKLGAFVSVLLAFYNALLAFFCSKRANRAEDWNVVYPIIVATIITFGLIMYCFFICDR